MSLTPLVEQAQNLLHQQNQATLPINPPEEGILEEGDGEEAAEEVEEERPRKQIQPIPKIQKMNNPTSMTKDGSKGQRQGHLNKHLNEK